MAYSDEDLRKYLLKAQEVLNSRNENQLSEEDLKDIAQELGIDTEEVAKIREDYLTRGNTHLNFGNYTEAIQEFEQLLLLAPNHPKGLYGMAKAYLEQWNNQGKKADKEKAFTYANQCIEVAPEYKKAYKIISALKGKPVKKGGTNQTRTAPANSQQQVSWRAYLVPAIIILAMVTGGVIGMTKFFKKSHEIHEYRVGATKEGFVIWQLAAKRYKKRPYRRDVKLTIADVATKKVLKEVAIPPRKGVNGNQLWKYSTQIGDSFYDINSTKGVFVARGVRTGEVTHNKAMLAAEFKELEGGVSKVKRERNDDWWVVTTKKGLTFWVNHKEKKIFNSQQYKQQRRAYAKVKRWVKVYNPANRNESKVILAEVKSPFGISGNRQLRMDGVRENKINTGRVKALISLDKTSYFLSPKLLYGDANYALITYKTEVGNAGQYRLACVDKTGKVLWQKGQEDFKNPLMSELIQKSLRRTSSFHFILHKNTLGMSKTVRVSAKRKYKYDRHHIALGLNLDTGNIAWQYSPTLYKTKFEKDKAK